MAPTGGRSLDHLGPAAFESVSFYVTQTGHYTLSSRGDFDRVILLYAGDFSPGRPLRNLVARTEFESNSSEPEACESFSALGGPSSTFDAVDGVLYHLVVSTRAGEPYPTPEPDGDSCAGEVATLVSGPGDAWMNVCRFVDDLFTPHDNGNVAEGTLQGDGFCVFAQWFSEDGEAHQAHLVPTRAHDAVSFWFFEPGNPELHVKLLNGCAINGFLWVLGSAATNVAYTFTVRWQGQESSLFGNDPRWPIGGVEQTYSNPPGQLAQAFADTAAFGCKTTP